MPKITLPEGKSLELQDNILLVTQELLKKVKQLNNLPSRQTETSQSPLPFNLKFCRSRKPNKNSKYTIKVRMIVPGKKPTKLGKIELNVPLNCSLYVNASPTDLDAVEEGNKSISECEPFLYALQHKNYIGDRRQRLIRFIPFTLDSHIVKFAAPLGSVSDIENGFATISTTPNENQVGVYKRTKKTGAYNDFLTYKGNNLFDHPSFNTVILWCEWMEKEYEKNPDIRFNDIKPENFAYSESQNKIFHIDRKALKRPVICTLDYYARWTLFPSASVARDIFALGKSITFLALSTNSQKQRPLLQAAGRHLVNEAKKMHDGGQAYQGDPIREVIEYLKRPHTSRALQENDNQLIKTLVAAKDSVCLQTKYDSIADLIDFFTSKLLSEDQQAAIALYLKYTQTRENMASTDSVQKLFFDDAQKSAMLICAMLGAKEYLTKKAHSLGKYAVIALIKALAEIDVTLEISRYRETLNSIVNDHTKNYRGKIDNGQEITVSASGKHKDSRKVIFEKYKIHESDNSNTIEARLLSIRFENALQVYMEDCKRKPNAPNSAVMEIVKKIHTENTLSYDIIVQSLEYLKSDSSASIGKNAVQAMIIALMTHQIKDNEAVKTAVTQCYQAKGTWASLFGKTGKRQQQFEAILKKYTYGH